LLLRELRSGGYDITWERVDTAAAMRAALAERTWDVIISDYAMPQFSAPAALTVLKESGFDLPFIIVSRNIGEDIAVAAMKAGAHDYIMKDNLARLTPAIERELREAIERAERKRAEEALRESEERYALAARGANDGLWDWNLKTNAIYFSARWKSMLGCEESEIQNSPAEWFNRVHPADFERLRAEIAAHLEGRTPHFEDEHRMLHRDGAYRWMLSRGLAVRDASGKAYRMAGSQTDITKRKDAEEQLLHDAFHDVLTGLPNRALLMDRLDLLVTRAQRRRDYLFAVLWLDLDRFKVVNDSLGHLMGDQLLVATARRLEGCLRPVDTVARIGGDEFTILLDDIRDASDAVRVADRIQRELALPFNVSGQEVFTSASIGIALSATGYERAEDVLRDADTAMYRAKALGKARHEVFDKAMHARTRALLQVETDLRRAVERREFRIHYQPIVSLETGTIAGFEALVRWDHPDRGLVAPGEFIPVAEDTGLIIPIGRVVLEEACRQAREWQARFPGGPPLSVSANLSMKQLLQRDLAQQIGQVLWETGLDADRLRLEITESMLMENVEYANTIVLQLRALDIRLSIDDFGTGYSSLSYLHRFPIDALKIDRSFVSGTGANERNPEIVRAIVTLARSLGVKVIAEGIETAEQLAQLRALDCEYGQGYFFSRPVDDERVRALIAARPRW
jgi:diguanylate cyclase (GGDEF)-like protein/PAS domain S-box-containing protein